MQACARGLCAAAGLFRAPAAAAAGFSTSASAASAAASPAGFIEVREYTLKPEGFVPYCKLTADNMHVRKELLPFLGMFTCDVGSLNKLTHLYAYKDHDERDAVREAASKDARWQQFVAEGRKHVLAQCNKVLMEAQPVYAALGLRSAAQYVPPPQQQGGKAMYELRQYQLHPGYGSVPKLVETFAKGLPAKVAADPERGELVFFGFTDVGTLNNVVELWRYSSAQSCIRARQAARQVPAWREAIAAVTPGVQHFTSEFLRPMAGSPWQ